MRKTTTIPDLRIDHTEFTLEHCSVLLVRLGKALDKIHGEGMSEIADQCDAEVMREDLLGICSARQLSILFETELGKGVIIGLFYGRFILPQPEDE